MRTDFPASGRSWLAALALAALLAGCAAPQPQLPPGPPPLPPQPEPAAADQPASAAAAPQAPITPVVVLRLATDPHDQVLAYADHVRSLSAAELAQEIQRLGESTYAPVPAMQLALALAQSRTAANQARAQTLLQRVLAQQDAQAQPLHPLARLLAAQLADQRRLDEQAEKQAQQLREAQKRIEQLNERLEAVRAIERSLPTQRNGAPPALGTPRPGAN